MNDTIAKAQAEAYRIEGDRRTVERIAKLIAEDCCPYSVKQGCDGNYRRDECVAHWLQYLTEHKS